MLAASTTRAVPSDMEVSASLFATSERGPILNRDTRSRVLGLALVLALALGCAVCGLSATVGGDLAARATLAGLARGQVIALVLAAAFATTASPAFSWLADVGGCGVGLVASATAAAGTATANAAALGCTFVVAFV